MRRPGLSIAGLMLLIVPIALALAAIRYASEFCEEALLSATLAILGFATLAAIERRDSRRSFWRGFALFGWGYSALLLGPWISDSFKSKIPTDAALVWLQGKLDDLGRRSYRNVFPEVTAEERSNRQNTTLSDPSRLVTILTASTPAEARIYAKTAYAFRDQLSAADLVKLAAHMELIDPTKRPIELRLYFDRDRIPMVGHLLWTWLAALFGGWLGRRLRDSNKTVL